MRLLRALGVLLILSAIAVALSRAPDLPVEALVGRWAPAPSDFLDIDGQLVHLRDEGAPRGKPPLVLLHGAGDSLHAWEGWVRALRGERRIITFDLPGNGLTGPSRSGDYHADTLARFVLALMDRLQVPRFVIGGHSMGGDVAWRVAALAPARVAGLVLVDATGPAYEPESVPLMLRFAQLPLVGALGDTLLPRAAVAATLQSLYGDPARVSAEQVDRSFELTRRAGNRAALRERLAQAADDAAPDVPQRLAALRTPTLLLWGDRDRLTPPSLARTYTRLIPGSQLVTFPGLGHLPHVEDPVATAQAVSAWGH